MPQVMTSVPVVRGKSLPEKTSSVCPHCHDGLLLELQAEKLRSLLQKLEEQAPSLRQESGTEESKKRRSALEWSANTIAEPTESFARFIPRDGRSRLVEEEAVVAPIIADGRESLASVSVKRGFSHGHMTIEFSHGGWLVEVSRVAFMLAHNHQVLYESSGEELRRFFKRRHQSVCRTTPRGVLLVGSGSRAGLGFRVPRKVRLKRADIILQMTYRAEPQVSHFVSECLRGVGLRTPVS